MADFKTVQPLADFDWEAFETGAVATGESHEQQEKVYAETLGKVNENEVVEGTIVAITKRDVTVSIGYKSEGTISISEFRYNPDLTVGDTVEVYIETQEDKNGQLILSHRKARLSKA